VHTHDDDHDDSDGHGEGSLCGVSATNDRLAREQLPRLTANYSHPAARRHGRRSAAGTTFNTCLVEAVADYSYYLSQNSQESTVVSRMLGHIAAASSIYQATSFVMSEAPTLTYTGLRLAVRKVTVYASAASDPYAGNDGTPLGLLTLFATQRDFSQNCIAHLFTSTDFSGGVLGLAWVGDTSGSKAGGMCHTSSNQWLNTGFSTALSYGVTVPLLTHTLVAIHEIGHNWCGFVLAGVLFGSLLFNIYGFVI
jgi:disintegrin and metalloproteinase domain-containing protein 17